MKSFFILLFNLLCLVCFAQTDPKLLSRMNQQAKEIEPKLIEWRRNFHEHPELSNQETKTGQIIATYLKSLGMEVQYPVAKTGVVGILKGGKPGPVVALRADMDGLPDDYETTTFGAIGVSGGEASDADGNGTSIEKVGGIGGSDSACGN